MSPSGNGRKSLAFRRSLEVKRPCADISDDESHEIRFEVPLGMGYQIPPGGAEWGGGDAVRELVREIYRARDIEIVKGHVGKDHVHLFVSVPPYLSVSKVMQYLKGKTSHKLLMEFAHLRRQFWGRHLWARGYFAASSGNVTDEVILQYIATQGQEPSESDEDLKIEE
jgi:REP-associated tyrosine transposase